MSTNPFDPDEDAALDTIGVPDADGVVEVDFSQAQSLEPLPDGGYMVQCTACKGGVSKAGFPKWDWQWKVIDGQYSNRIIFDSISFHPKALGRTKTILKQLGFNVEGRQRVNPASAVNLTAMARVGVQVSTQTDPETGELYPPRNRIKSFKRIANPELA